MADTEQRKKCIQGIGGKSCRHMHWWDSGLESSASLTLTTGTPFSIQQWNLKFPKKWTIFHLPNEPSNSERLHSSSSVTYKQDELQ